MGNLFDVLICACVLVLMNGAGMLITADTPESLRDLVGVLVYVIFTGGIGVMVLGLVWILFLRESRMFRNTAVMKRGRLFKGKGRASLVLADETTLAAEFGRLYRDNPDGENLIAEKIKALNETEDLQVDYWICIVGKKSVSQFQRNQIVG